MDEWIKTLWYIYPHIYAYIRTHTHTHNEILFSHKKECNLAIYDDMDDLEGIMLSEISQTEKDNYHMIPYIHGIYKQTNKTKLINTEDKLMLARGKGETGGLFFVCLALV